MRPGRVSLSNLSIKHRLPLLIGILLLGTIVASTWASYRAVKDAALRVGQERLLNLTQQLATLSQQSSSLLIGKTFTAANDPAVRSFLLSPQADASAGMKTVLSQFSTANDVGSVQVELWRADGTLVFTLPENLKPQPSDLAVEFKQVSAEPFKAVGAMRVLDGVALYPAVAASRDESGKVIGYLVRWRRLSASPDSRKQLSDLLGSEAAIYFGNARGDLWTDLVQPVPKPPVNLGSTLEATHYERDGESVMALGRAINGTPWFVIIEFPDHAFLTPARRLLRSMTLIGLSLLVIGVFGAFLLSRNITRPLHSLTEAASTISGGDYSGSINLRQKDELGILANAFNLMGTKIRDAQGELERKVHERTIQFEAAPSAMLMINDAGLITIANTQAEKLFGYSREELLGLSAENLLPERYRTPGQPFKSRTSKPLGEGRDFYALQKDGSEIPVEIGINPLQTSEGDFILASIIDISERRRSEEQFRQLIEYAPNGKVMVNAEGIIVLVNAKMELMFGYDREELLGQPIEILVPPRFKHHAAQRIEFQSCPSPVKIGAGRELAGLRKNGSEFPVEIALNPLQTEAGTMIVGTIMDITERRLAEEKLRDSEERLRLSLEGAGLGTWDYRFETGEVYWDERGCRNYGFTEELTSYEATTDRIHVDDRQRVQQGVEAALSGLNDGNYKEDFRVWWPDGSMHWIAALGRVYFEGEGEDRRAIRFTGTNLDITERKRAEELLREQAQILDLAPILARDLDDRILMWNRGAQELYGFTSDEALEMVSDELLQTEFPAAKETIIQTFYSEGQWQGELIHTRRDGKRIVVASQWVLHHDQSNQPKAILEINNDITARKQVEQEIVRLNEELEQRVADRTAQLMSANQELEAFSYSVSHDLRAPLRHLAGYAELLHKHGEPHLDEKDHRYVRTIIESSNRMGELIDGLLSFSRLGRAELKKKPLALQQVVKETVHELTETYRDPRVRWKIGFLPDVSGDPTLLRLVFTNLISNALKFSRDNEHPEIEIGCTINDGEVVVKVADNGAGFDMKYADKLFGVFQRLHRADEFDGTGIGLANVRRIIQRHGGRTWAEGAVDQGAAFYFSLPLEPQRVSV